MSLFLSIICSHKSLPSRNHINWHSLFLFDICDLLILLGLEYGAYFCLHHFSWLKTNKHPYAAMTVSMLHARLSIDTTILFNTLYTNMHSYFSFFFCHICSSSSLAETRAICKALAKKRIFPFFYIFKKGKLSPKLLQEWFKKCNRAHWAMNSFLEINWVFLLTMDLPKPYPSLSHILTTW